MTSDALGWLAGSRRQTLLRAAGGRSGRHLESVTSCQNYDSLFAKMLKEQSCEIPGRSDLNRRSLRFFCRASLQQEEEEEEEEEQDE